MTKNRTEDTISFFALGYSDDALDLDTLHPSGMQYSLWVERILPVILNVFVN